MTTTAESLSAALLDHAHSAHPVRPELGDPGYRGWMILRMLGCVASEARLDGPLMAVASRLPISDGRTVLGPNALALLDRALADEVDTVTFFEALASAIQNDLTLDAMPTPGSLR